MEAKKLPAAPALCNRQHRDVKETSGEDLHNKVNSTELLDAALRGIFQALKLPDIHCADTNHLGTRANCCNLLGRALGLFYIASNDTSVGT